MGAINLSQIKKVASLGASQASNLQELNQYRRVDGLASSINQYNTTLLSASSDNFRAQLLTNRNNSNFRATASARGINVETAEFSNRERARDNEVDRMISMNSQIIERARLMSQLQLSELQSDFAVRRSRGFGNIATDFGRIFLGGLLT